MFLSRLYIEPMAFTLLQSMTFYPNQLAVELFICIHVFFVCYKSVMSRVLHSYDIWFDLSQCTLLRDNCAIETTYGVSTFCGTDNIETARHRHHKVDSLHTFDTEPSCIDWLSLFQLMHQISSSVIDEPILYEAICIMNVILNRFGSSDRERLVWIFSRVFILYSNIESAHKEYDFTDLDRFQFFNQCPNS